MNKSEKREKLGLNIKSLRIADKILIENPEIKKIFDSSNSFDKAIRKLRDWVILYLQKNPHTSNYYYRKNKGHTALKRIAFRDYAAIRLMDYIDNEGRVFTDPNYKNIKTTSSPIKNLWLAAKHGKGNAHEDFFVDILFLFRQLNGKLSRRQPQPKFVENWMKRHPSGLEKDIQSLRLQNKERILKKIIRKIDEGEMKSKRFSFDDGLSTKEKYQTALKWWNDYRFHLVFAIRTPKVLNEMLDYSLRKKTMKLLERAQEKGIPIFVNPYYLSLINVDITPGKTGADRPLRDYILPNKELISEFGSINAWEKEDIFLAGEPNAAGWILPPYRNVHRRYPEVAIFIPDTAGRACGGLCVSCQRMYDFQSGRFNFDLSKLAPKITWSEKMEILLEYWENDTQLRDILITGGDALMNTDKSLSDILDKVYQMVVRKREANQNRPDGEKYAEILRVRLGSRLPVYLPQRITPELTKILKKFKEKASKVGVKQFFIQTHIQSAMEITPIVKKGIKMLRQAGWTVTNQVVFTTATSRRGHTAKLRQVLTQIGVIPYYTFSVKGFLENKYNFATNERLAQERVEEKYLGQPANQKIKEITPLLIDSKEVVNNVKQFKEANGLSFLSTDRSVLNMPGVGKSLTYRTIGITDDGRRILEFEHDQNRNHSPIIDSMGNVVIIESKSINAYLRQLEEIGEDPEDYKTIWGYSASETESRAQFYRYPEYDFKITGEYTKFPDGEFNN